MSLVMPTVYPVTNTLPRTNGSSNGSYGSVFLVLAAIIVISAFACFLGRLCNKRQNVPKPSTHSHSRKEKDTKGNSNVIQTKDGDIEFGYDKRFASAKVASSNEPAMARPNPFGEPNMARPNSFREPNIGRPVHDEPTIRQPNSFHKSNNVPSSLHEPSMGRSSNSFHEPNMGQSNTFHNAEPQGRQVRFGDHDRDNEINFKIRTRPHRY